MNAFEQYINSRMEEIAREDMSKEDEKSLQTITVRVSPYRVRMIDNLAKDLDLSRQSVLASIIDIGVQQAVSAYADTFGEDSQKVYMELLEAAK